MAIKHLVLHVGVPKTGTSLIQRSLRRLRPQLRERGVAYIDRRQMHRLEHRPSWAAYEARPAAEGKAAFAKELRRIVRSELRRVDSRPKTVLLSNESMISQVAPHFGDPYWPRVAASLGEIIDSLEPQRTRVLMYVRRQDRLLESMYMQQVHLGKPLEWDTFIERTGKDDRVRYRDVVDAITKVPTVESIHVRPFETIGAGAKPFVADYLAYFGLADLIGLIENFRKSNQSYTDPAWKAALTINPHLRTTEQRDETRKFLRQLFPAEEYPKAKLMTPAERARLLEIYAPANESFFRDYLPEYPADSYLSEEATRRLGTMVPGSDVAAVT